MRARSAVALAALVLATLASCSSPARANSLDVQVKESLTGVVLTAPTTVAGGAVKVTLHNAGQLVHDLQLVRVDGNHPVEEVVSLLTGAGQPYPPWFHAAGGITTTATGATQEAVMNLPAGSYVMVDTNSDVNGTAFAGIGGVKAFTVTAPAGPGKSGKLPSADLTIRAKEYTYGLPGTIPAGNHTVRFQNEGLELHHLVAVPILPGKTLEDVAKSLVADPSTSPPAASFNAATGAAVLDGGTSLVTHMTFTKGTYAFICFLSDRSGGPPHFLRGMIQGITVA